MRKEIPILFSTDMVWALMDGCKTQTRRTKGLESVNSEPDKWHLSGFANAVSRTKVDRLCALFISEDGQAADAICPYGWLGDWLWVRESFRFDQIEADKVRYKANAHDDIFKEHNWKPSIHLKKANSRVWLENAEISIERLFDISEADAIAEGVESWPCKQINGLEYRNYLLKGDLGRQWPNTELSARQSFMSLWQYVNGEESASSNPWVWVVKFKILSTTGKPAEAV